MNRWVEEEMNRRGQGPKTFEEYEKLDKIHKDSIPYAEVKRLRSEYDMRKNSEEIGSRLKNINFD